jgi:threonine/homoserine/homoserine lactone efflux protein
MTIELMGSLVLFALIASITPGPNNIMLASSGLNFGLRRTVPHIMGVCIGFVLMVILVGLGLGSVFRRWPELHTVLKYVGALYLLYLAVRIARAGTIETGKATNRPFTFTQAAAFQWVNPKAWIMAIGVVATYTPSTAFFTNLIIVSLICGLVNLPSVALWAAFGTALRRFLHKPASVRLFNLSMAAMLVASLYPVGREGYMALIEAASAW